nr:prohibitin-1, mitochondrial-like [Ipomoea batatas]
MESARVERTIAQALADVGLTSDLSDGHREISEQAQIEGEGEGEARWPASRDEQSALASGGEAAVTGIGKMNLNNVKVPKMPGGGVVSALIKLSLVAGIGVYGVANSLCNVEGGHRAIVFNRIGGIKDKLKPSTLSKLLDDHGFSLSGGNAKTAIICTMSPARSHVEQSRNTLVFASCAKEVTSNAQVNVSYVWTKFW